MMVSQCSALAAHDARESARWVGRHYGTTDGLPVDSANAAVIDDDGFLWLATHDGLARFDGAHFELYDSLSFPAMTGNRVLSVWRDLQGRVFANTEGGDWLRIESDRISSAFAEAPEEAVVRHVDPVSRCVTTSAALQCPETDGLYRATLAFPAGVDVALTLVGVDGSTWLLSRERDVWRHHDGQWRRLWRAARHGRPALTLLGAVDRDDRLWVEMGERLLWVNRSGQHAWLDQPNDPRGVQQIRSDEAGGLWIGAANGLFKIEGQQLTRWFGSDGATSDRAWLSWGAPDGALWIAKDTELYRLDSGADSTTVLGVPVLRSAGRIHNLAFGPDDLVWVMTLQDGVHRLSRARVERLATAPERGISNVYGISHGPDGTIWLGTLGSGVMAIATDGTVSTHDLDAGLPGRNPWVVSVAPDGAIYAATYAPGLWRMAAYASRFEPVELPSPLRREQVRAILFPEQDPSTFWLGTTNGAWRYQSGQWQRIWPQEEEHRARVSAIAMADSRVWLGSDEGVWLLEKGKVGPVAPMLLAHASIRGLDLGSDGALWISTDGRGLVRVAANDPSGTQALHLTRKHGLPSNTPHAVREDAEENLWVNSNQGIFRISRPNLVSVLEGRERRLTPLLLSLSDGLPELEGNGGVQPTSAEDAQGRLLFASQNGVVRVDPLAMPLHLNPPRARIDALEHQGLAVTRDEGDGLPIGLRTLRIHYGAADLAGNGQSRFRYRMLPSSTYWSDAMSERSVEFGALAPGRYRFEVLAGNSDGFWAEEPTSLAFEVPPYWYETRYFRIGLLLLGLLLIGFAMHWRVRHLHRRARVLNHAVRTRTRELRRENKRVEQAMSELTQTYQTLEDRNLTLADQTQQLEKLDSFRRRVLADVSHELRTPVMLVELPLEELDQHAEKLGAQGRERLQLARRQLGRLRVLVEQLVGLIQAESGQMPMRLKRVDLTAFLQRLVEDYRPKAEKVGVRLQLYTPEPVEPLYADPVQLTTIFGNLIDNALKYAPEQSEVRLILEQLEDGLQVAVCDQGRGFDGALTRQLFERFYRGDGPPRYGREGLGIGLSLVHELVRLHGGHISAESRPGEGARFQVWLPSGTEHVALQDLALDTPSADVPAVMPDRLDADAQGCILLVEDHPDLASYLTERLGNRICTVCANSAEEALRLLKVDCRIRLVVSDVVLPGRSGIELCRELNHGSPAQHVPVILISARAGQQDLDAGLAAGAAAYLAKPFGFDSLIRAIVQVWPAVRSRLEPPTATPENVDPILRAALMQMHEPAFNIAEWAELVHLSGRQLRRRVKELTDQSPQHWLREQRLLRVHRLLREGRCKTLLQAGQQSGLENPSYLYRSYRARFGADMA